MHKRRPATAVASASHDSRCSVGTSCSAVATQNPLASVNETQSGATAAAAIARRTRMILNPPTSLETHRQNTQYIRDISTSPSHGKGESRSLHGTFALRPNFGMGCFTPAATVAQYGEPGVALDGPRDERRARIAPTLEPKCSAKSISREIRRQSPRIRVATIPRFAVTTCTHWSQPFLTTEVL